MATNFIWRILVANAANATQPTAPALGSNIASVSGWTSIGSVARGDDANLDEDSVDIAFFDSDGEILPPVALTREAIVTMQNGVDGFEFTCYDASETLLALASDISVTSNVATKILEAVNRSVVIEVNGLFFDYFPNVKLAVTSVPMGIGSDGQAKTTFAGKCCAGTLVPGGWNRKWYQ